MVENFSNVAIRSRRAACGHCVETGEGGSIRDTDTVGYHCIDARLQALCARWPRQSCRRPAAGTRLSGQLEATHLKAGFTSIAGTRPSMLLSGYH